MTYLSDVLGAVLLLRAAGLLCAQLFAHLRHEHLLHGERLSERRSLTPLLL